MNYQATKAVLDGFDSEVIGRIHAGTLRRYP
jgi:hypothetical protein